MTLKTESVRCGSRQEYEACVAREASMMQPMPAEHAYFNDTRPAFDVGATRDSFARTLSFFASVLS